MGRDRRILAEVSERPEALEATRLLAREGARPGAIARVVGINERLAAAIYRHENRRAPPRGRLPSSGAWIAASRPRRFQASVLVTLYAASGAREPGLRMARAYARYAELYPRCDITATRALILLDLHRRGELAVNACPRCSSAFVYLPGEETLSRIECPACGTASRPEIEPREQKQGAFAA